MKKVILIASIILTISGNCFAAADLTGKWVLSSRICTDGKPTNDALDLNNSEFQIEFYADSVNSFSKIKNSSGDYQYDSMQGTYNTIGNFLTIEIISSSYPTEKNQSIVYSLTQDNRLIFITADFGDDGTCNKGQALVTFFTKK